MNNKRDGNIFERRFARALSVKGYWVHLLKDNHNGQPFDVIAVKNNIAYAFDCKLCIRGYFKADRIEVNQHLAFSKMKSCGNVNCYLALGYGDMVYCVKVDKVKGDLTIEEAKKIADYIIKLC